MNPLLIVGAVAAFLACVVFAEGVVIHGKDVQIAADANVLSDMTGQRDAQAAGLGQCNEEKDRQQAEIDAGDQKATQAAHDQQSAAQGLATQNENLKADNDKLFQSYEEAINARPTNITVQQAYPTGWDPIVAAAARYVRSLQLSAPNDGSDGTDGGVPGSHDPGGPSATRTAPGSGLAAVADASGPEGRPSAQQQIDLMNYVSQLYHWGASCYADKRAIAASQQTK